MLPEIRLSFLFINIKGKSSSVTPSIGIISKLIISGFTFISVTILVIPRIENILKILDPIKLPNARSVSFLIAATIAVTNSGNDVPKANTVIPITR